MSVQTIDIEIFEAVYQKAHRYTFNKQVDINYCNVLGSKTEKELQDLIRAWSRLNELSYRDKYEPATVEDEATLLHSFIVFEKRSNINTYQMLKYLEAIRYNIEEDIIIRWLTVVEASSLVTLSAAINEIRKQIVQATPEYNAAKWSTI